MSTTGQLRFTVLHPEATLSPALCREWLRVESNDLQSKASEHDIIVVRLYLPARLITGITRRKLDALLSEIVSTHSNIHRIDLREVAKTLTAEEMLDAAAEAEHDIEVLLQNLSETDRS